MKIEKVKINELKNNPNNPRVIMDDQFKKLVKSIQDFPEMLDIRPIVVDDNMMVLGGNMRLKACDNAGLTEVSIIKASNLTEEQKKEFIIKDNVGYGEWDWGMLQTEWEVDLLEDWGITGLVSSSLLDTVNSGDENSEWIGMPEFNKPDKEIKLIITFENESDRDEFCKIGSYKPSKGSLISWSMRWPDNENMDTSSIKIV